MEATVKSKLDVFLVRTGLTSSLSLSLFTLLSFSSLVGVSPADKKAPTPAGKSKEK